MIGEFWPSDRYVPKYGDIVRLNPAGCRHRALIPLCEMNENTCKIASVVSDYGNPLNATVELQYTNCTVRLWICAIEGHYWEEPHGSPPLFLPIKQHQELCPINNDGRAECFWCGTATEHKMGFTKCYNICPKCVK